MSDITTLNRKRSGIKSQLTKLNNVLKEGQSKMDIPELQAQLYSVLNIKQKYEALKEEYYRISKEKEFQKVEASIYEVDDDIQKLENLDILDKTLKRFWEIEEVETTEVYSDELKYCNDHFEKTHLRKPDGKFVVEMPFKPDSSEGILENSKAIASKRLDQLWTRLERDPAMQTLYSEFLNEYELLQHMEEVKEDSDVENGYYLPHHGVLRLSSKTTRLTVVFNASAKTSSGLSLNDLLCKGGVIQEDLFSILIRFRKYAYAFTADIRQMFRMIEVNPSQTKLQKILWKNSKTAPTKVYELKTVTYGTASAPYLATRVLQQLALDEEKDFPLASELLQRGGLTLHKWCSNKAPSTELREFSLDRSSDEVMVKTLDMLWDSLGDSFTYKVTPSTDCNYTKRDVLSQIARIYDPLGLLGPVIAKAKIFMQQLWLLKLDWNETLPPDVSTQWRNFIQSLKDIESIHVPRCFLVVPTKFVVLNGFADASSKACGAVIYVQTNETTNQLLCSKSRLAPIKSMTIPRLELCSCLLLAKLIHKVKAALKMQINSVNLYSDSTIALAWINSPSNLLKTFVSNRVSQIQELSRDFQWQHVPSELNPADLISRGLDDKTLATSELWFKGPDFSKLCLPSHRTEQNYSDLTDQFYINELKPVPKLTLSLNNDSKFLDELLSITNDFFKLIRILAFIFSAKFSSATGNRSVAANVSKGLKLFDDKFISKILFTEPDCLVHDDFFIQGFVKAEMKKRMTYKPSVQIRATCQNPAVYFQVDDHVDPGNCPAAVSSEKTRPSSYGVLPSPAELGYGINRCPRDLDESPDPSMSKIVLRDLIISSKYYKEEEAKELLEVITAERLETEQQQKLEQQEQLSIEKLRLEIELSRNAN
ncbi:uncharacterized protein TNCV_3441181 [Trichonephila clavipes]|uniref:Uncharacterized protein n=1 Tax=Trichonephila clavipes TaxID=2585209 RepID=A0A8X6W6S7_TRICX|nr:uncharacterized protein TNCV_3441181 [Trichonephila clavipes]